MKMIEESGSKLKGVGGLNQKFVTARSRGVNV